MTSTAGQRSPPRTPTATSPAPPIQALTITKKSLPTKNITIPSAPKCLEEWGTSYGILSLHIYYIDDPWNIRCKNGDSVKPAPVMGRLMLNGYRYANQVADEVKRLFSG